MRSLPVVEKDRPIGSSKILVDAYFKLPKETFELFTRSADTYTKLFEAWRHSSDVLASGKPESQELYSVWAKDFKGVYDDMFEMLFRPMKLLSGSPWTDSFSQMSELARLSWPAGGFGNMDTLFKPYENLIYLIPKEVPHLFSKVMNSYTDFFSALRDYYAGFHKAWEEATEKLSKELVDKMAVLQKDQEKPIDFATFYELWHETFSKTYTKLLSLPDMVSVQTRLSSSTMDLIKHWREMSEAIMSVSPAFPFPTKSEMDETYKRLHLLRKDIEEVSQRIEAQPKRSEIDEVYKSLRVLKEQVDGISQKVEAQPKRSEMNEPHESLRVVKKEANKIRRGVKAQRTRPRQAPKQE